MVRKGVLSAGSADRPRPGSEAAPNSDVRLERLRRLAYWLDEGLRVPGTRLRVGLDPIFGLVPGLGDAAGAILSAWILVEAARRGASRGTLIRIASNIAVDALLGVIPLAGDAFDAVWKANSRSVALLERHVVDPAGARQADGLFVILLVGSVLLLSGLLLVSGILLAARLIGAVVGAE